jgi:hypothetical protein
MRRFILSLLLSIVTVVSYSVPVQATTTTLTVIGDGTDVGGSYAGGAGTWANMNDDNDDTSYWTGTATGTGTMAHSWQPSNTIPAHIAINSVTMYAKVKESAPGTYGISDRDFVEIGGIRYFSGARRPAAVYTLYSSTWATNPATGVAWTEAQIYAADWGHAEYSGYGDTCTARISYLYLVVDYTATYAPIVTTQAVTAITPTTATGNGNVTDDGGAALTEKGICYKAGASGDPTTADSTSHDHINVEGAFTAAIAGLTKGTAYRARAYAINATGIGYGVTEGFTTIGDPTITTSAASLVSSTTARLNSNVTFDGSVVTGEPCTIRFVYIAGTGYANYAAIVAGAETTVDVAGTWIQGQSPYADITGLTVSTTYSYAVRIVNSTATYAYGSVVTFTTESGVYTPTNFTAIPTATSVSLAWAKGVGAQYTLVKYSDASYPLVVGDGIGAYLGAGNSKTLTGLTPGTTYYFTAWGNTAAVYSAGAGINTIVTTLAYDTAGSTGTIEAPPSNSWWNQTPSASKVGSIPVVSALVTQSATVYAIPEASLWYFLWVLFSVGMGVIIYIKAGMNLVAGLGSQALLFALGAVLGLTMLWIMVIFMVIGAGFTLWGNRH